jgi:anaerobic magnesium-protoporphyrin IX monomethyl ester cyclase
VLSIVLFNMLWEMGTIGLPNLVTHLKAHGYPSKQVYLTKHEPESAQELEAILAFVAKEKPDLVGFSLMSFNFERTKRITAEIKRRLEGLPIIWGGIHPTFEPEESIQFADYVCVGEGEQALLELVQAIDSGWPTDAIPNIWSKKNGLVIKNDVRALIQNLDEYPYPQMDWENTFVLDEGRIKPLTHQLYRKYVQYSGTMYDIMASRGCPYSCSYCGNALYRQIYRGKGRYVRFRSVDNVIEELRYAQREFPFIDMINIQDDAFAAAPARYLKEFAGKYKEQIGLPLRVRVLPTMLPEEKVSYLKEANTLVAVLGIQSSDRINEEVFNRHASSETLIKAARLLDKYGIVVQYDLIVQNPYESEADVAETCEILSNLPKPFVLIRYPLALFPNTPLRTRAVEDGIPINPRDGYETPYGSFPIEHPYLYRLQEASQITPKSLMDFFLHKREKLLVRMLFAVYFFVFYKSIEAARKLVMRNTKLVRWTKEAIYLPRRVLGRARFLF